MGIDKLKRVMWRLREKHPDLSYVPTKDLEHAIYIECGTDFRTRTNNINAILRLKWLKHKHRDVYYCPDTNNIEWSI
jgi:hypothetical protein